MSNYITQVWNKEYYCIDWYFWWRKYWYQEIVNWKEVGRVLMELPQEYTPLCLNCAKFHKKSEDCILLS